MVSTDDSLDDDYHLSTFRSYVGYVTAEVLVVFVSIVYTDYLFRFQMDRPSTEVLIITIVVLFLLMQVSLLRASTTYPDPIPYRYHLSKEEYMLARNREAVPEVEFEVMAAKRGCLIRRELDDGKTVVNICLKCQIVMPDRAFHCKTCRTCVMRLDHHCFILNVCIQPCNHKLFILSVFYAVCGLCTILVSSILYIVEDLCDPKRNNIPSETYLKVLFYVMLTLCAILCTFGVPFLFYHLYLVSINCTHVEMAYSNTVFIDRSRTYDLGCRKNFAYVCGWNILLWLFPVKAPTKAAYSFETRVTVADAAITINGRPVLNTFTSTLDGSSSSKTEKKLIV